MPHPSSTVKIQNHHLGWGHKFGRHWGGGVDAGFVVGGQVVRRPRGWRKGERLVNRVRVAKL